MASLCIDFAIFLCDKDGKENKVCKKTTIAHAHRSNNSSSKCMIFTATITDQRSDNPAWLQISDCEGLVKFFSFLFNSDLTMSVFILYSLYRHIIYAFVIRGATLPKKILNTMYLALIKEYVLPREHFAWGYQKLILIPLCSSTWLKVFCDGRFEMKSCVELLFQQLSLTV